MIHMNVVRQVRRAHRFSTYSLGVVTSYARARILDLHGFSSPGIRREWFTTYMFMITTVLEPGVMWRSVPIILVHSLETLYGISKC